jgi:hypothetical protein
LFVKWEKSATIEVISNSDFEKKLEQVVAYGDINAERFEKKIELNSKIDYQNIMQNLQLQNKKQIAPLYIKKPNIS